jgi:hypothetical protein
MASSGRIFDADIGSQDGVVSTGELAIVHWDLEIVQLCMKSALVDNT